MTIAEVLYRWLEANGWVDWLRQLRAVLMAAATYTARLLQAPPRYVQLAMSL